RRGHLRPGRARPRRAGPPHRHAPRARRPLRVTHFSPVLTPRAPKIDQENEGSRTLAHLMSATYPVRVFGDPVLKQKAKDVTDIDGALARFVDTMVDTMYDAAGVGLAAPQVGVQKR